MMDASWKKRNNARICKDKIDNFPVNPFLNSQTQVILKAQYITFLNFVHVHVSCILIQFSFTFDNYSCFSSLFFTYTYSCGFVFSFTFLKYVMFVYFVISAHER